MRANFVAPGNHSCDPPFQHVEALLPRQRRLLDSFTEVDFSDLAICAIALAAIRRGIVQRPAASSDLACRPLSLIM
jgi:hypothetical protein